MIEEVIQYGYKYEKDYDLYLVRRVDGEHLRYVVPSGLFKNIVMEEEKRLGKKLFVVNEDGFIHFDSKGTNAIVDLKGLNYTTEQVDEIVRGIESQYVVTMEPKSVGRSRFLSIFKNIGRKQHCYFLFCLKKYT